MPADVCLAIKAYDKCSGFTWVLLFSKVSAQYIILVKIFPSLPPLGFVLCYAIKLHFEINHAYGTSSTPVFKVQLQNECTTFCYLTYVLSSENIFSFFSCLLCIYTNHKGGNLVKKYQTIKFEAVG